MTTLINAQELGKCYHIYANHIQYLKTLLWPGLKKGRFAETWALRNVNFSVRAGEVVGIVGRNGSGKSTLLQLVAGTLTPTQGRVDVQGRVAALLELGSGFNADFTGRENVFLNGLLLGASREEITERLADIEAFAEIGRYFDQPVKTYSSGMVVRLAFAVQVLLDKDILIVDEALAVGDEVFQRKCFAAIERFREGGGTVLFVSHSGETVIQLCDRALLLHHGQLILQGNAKRVMDWYHKLIYAPVEAEARILARMQEVPDAEPAEALAVAGLLAIVPVAGDVAMAKVEPAMGMESDDYDPNLRSRSVLFYEDRGAKIGAFALYDHHGRRVNVLRPRQTYVWSYEVEFTELAQRVRFGMTIKTASGLELGGATTARAFQEIPLVEAGWKLSISFKFVNLLEEGIYFLNAGVGGEREGVEHYLARAIDLSVFRVANVENRLLSGGPMDFLIRVRVERIDGDQSVLSSNPDF